MPAATGRPERACGSTCPRRQVDVAMVMASTVIQGSAVAIGGRALLIFGPPGSGKTSLALALIDRGATLIGDNGDTMARAGDCVIARLPPNIAGLLEVWNMCLISLPPSSDPVSLTLHLLIACARLL